MSGFNAEDLQRKAFRSTTRTNEKGESETSYSWEPGSAEKVAAAAAAGAVVGNIVPLIGVPIGAAVGAGLAFIFG